MGTLVAHSWADARAPFQNALRLLGFRRDHVSKDCICYVRENAERALDVQLWSDGAHRASHCMIDPADPRPRRSSTPPTDFATVDGMMVAIITELFRRDHPAVEQR